MATVRLIGVIIAITLFARVGMAMQLFQGKAGTLAQPTLHGSASCGDSTAGTSTGNCTLNTTGCTSCYIVVSLALRLTSTSAHSCTYNAAAVNDDIRNDASGAATGEAYVAGEFLESVGNFDAACSWTGTSNWALTISAWNGVNSTDGTHSDFGGGASSTSPSATTAAGTASNHVVVGIISTVQIALADVTPDGSQTELQEVGGSGTPPNAVNNLSWESGGGAVVFSGTLGDSRGWAVTGFVLQP